MELIGSNRQRSPILFNWYVLGFQDRKMFMRVAKANRFYQAAKTGISGRIEELPAPAKCTEG